MADLAPVNALSRLAESDSDSDNAEAIAQRTTGRLLARLQPGSIDESSEEDNADSEEDTYERTKRRLFAARENENAASSGEEEEDNGHGQGAYERMKQRLMASTGLQRRTQDEPTQNAQKPASVGGSLSDENDAPVRANRVRKPLTRRERTLSPTVSPAVSTRSRRSSFGLFVTPEPSPSKRQAPNVSLGDDASEHNTPTRSTEFRERVERIRAERLAKQREEKQRRTKNSKQGEDAEPGSNSDGEGSRRLTQQAKPTRKAGKKALEAMARDQQRLVRNMQLTHQAKTKKRYGTKDLFAKLGFNQGLENSETTGLPTPETSSVPATSDVEATQAHDTPPTSPPKFDDETMTGMDESVPAMSLKESAIPSLGRADKGKGRAPEFQHLPPNQMMQIKPEVTMQNVRLASDKPKEEIMIDLDSEDEIEVVKPQSRFPVFDKLPERKAREHPSVLHLRHLAQLTSPGKKAPKGKKTMNMVQLQGTLFQKAREQAQKERQEKIEMLKAKGIIIETEEEREKRQMEIEDLVAQFEKEKERDLKLAKHERKLAKKEGELGDGLASSDEDDEDYVASGGEENPAEDVDGAEDDELELSGSEDEEADDEEDLDEDEGEEMPSEEDVDPSNTLLDTMANEDHESREAIAEQDVDNDMPDAEDTVPVRQSFASRSRKVVVDDDDDEEENTAQLGSPTQVATQDETMAAFGFGNTTTGLGLTQAFAGTMANIESDSQTNQPFSQEPEQDSIGFLRSLPDSQPVPSQSHELFVPNSQVADSQQEPIQDGSVLPMHLGISQLMEDTNMFSPTQVSEAPEPTQDAGFLLSRSPAGMRPPQSTVDTVMLAVAESPIAQRKGKLHRRRREAPLVLSDVDDDNVFSASDGEAEAGPTATEDAFSFMQKAAKKQKKVDTFNKKTSAAREHLDEQAYESDDEYKGLGGASDDDSADDDADLEEMIDTSDVKVDERKIAALFADKARKDHDASVAKIYKDLQTGAFRKRGVADAFDMSDSEDELEMRRRKKQREFEQMYRALKADEVIGKMAENPKRKAFFDTLMDHSDDSDLEFLDHPDENGGAEESPEQTQEVAPLEPEISIPDSQNAPVQTTKAVAVAELDKENRPPAPMRRTAAPAIPRRPISAADVKDSVAELLNSPHDILIPDSQFSLSDSEDESPSTSTSTSSSTPHTVTNRLSRTPSLPSDASTRSNLAFQAPSSLSAPGFRVPSLIRRATSNLSVASERSASSASASALGVKEGGVRRGGTGKSNIHAQAREAERRVGVEKREKRRVEELKRKVGRERGRGSVLRALEGGFE